MRMTILKKTILIILLIIVGVMSVFVIPKQTKPSPDTRIVLEHTHKTYIAPRCFQQADATNFLGDSDLKEAEELKYEPHDTCTEDALAPKQDRLIVSLLKDIGLLSKKWDNW